MNTSAQKDENRYIAKVLAKVAGLLQQQNASSFRVGAYRKAADYVA
ncbi:MAG: DNA polymerase/3'-5' exonuclease PolX [Yoonia sp.]|jgi:DNA polymerase/3'-5' exonuclease PolX